MSVWNFSQVPTLRFIGVSFFGQILTNFRSYWFSQVSIQLSNCLFRPGPGFLIYTVTLNCLFESYLTDKNVNFEVVGYFVNWLFKLFPVFVHVLFFSNIFHMFRIFGLRILTKCQTHFFGMFFFFSQVKKGKKVLYACLDEWFPTYLVEENICTHLSLKLK